MPKVGKRLKIKGYKMKGGTARVDVGEYSRSHAKPHAVKPHFRIFRKWRAGRAAKRAAKVKS